MNWNELSISKQMSEVMKADADVSHFFESDLFMPDITLFPKQKELLSRFYDEGKKEMILVAGMRGGKTKLSCFFILYELFQLLKLDNPVKSFDLVPGENIFLTAVAYKEKQAIQNMESQIMALIEGSPFFNQFNYENKYNQIRFPDKNIIVMFGGSQTPGLLGKTAKAVVFDEIASYKKTGKYSGESAYEKVSKSVETFGQEGHVICISSVDNPNDIIMTLYNRYKDRDDILTEMLTTWEMNPRISREDLQDEFEKNPIAARRDFACEPLAGAENYFKQNAINKLEDSMNERKNNILKSIHDGESYEIEPGNYVLAGDPALRHDAFGLALTRRTSSGLFKVDGLYRFKPESGDLDPTIVSEFIYDVVDRVPVNTFVVDTWQYPNIEKKLENKGLNIEQHIVRKEEYDQFRIELFDGKVEMCYYPFIIEEFKDLQVKKSGKVDHTENGSKDVADALVNSFWVHNEKNVSDRVPYNRAISL